VATRGIECWAVFVQFFTHSSYNTFGLGAIGRNSLRSATWPPPLSPQRQPICKTSRRVPREWVGNWCVYLAAASCERCDGLSLNKVPQSSRRSHAIPRARRERPMGESRLFVEHKSPWIPTQLSR